MRAAIRFAIATAILFLSISSALGQRTCTRSSWEESLMIPSVSGYETSFTQLIRAELKDLSPQTDNLGSVYVTLGSGSPRRLIVTPIDQPGYVVSDITSDGYLRVQRLPQRPPTPIFDSLNFAQPVVIETRSGKKVPGVFAGLSVHLQPLRQNPPKMLQPEDLYIDIGAKNTEEVRAAGVDLLNPVALLPSIQKLADGNYAGPGIGDHFGADVLVHLLNDLAPLKQGIKGTLTVAFVTQSWTGGRGFERMLRETSPDEVIYVNRVTRPKQDAPSEAADTPGDGVLLGVKSSAIAKPGIGTDLKELADQNKIRARLEAAELPRIRGYVEPTPQPERFLVAGVAAQFPVTPAETLNQSDTDELEGLLYLYLTRKPHPHVIAGDGTGGGCFSAKTPLIAILAEAYGASGHESAVRETVTQQIPDWAQKKLVTDKAGNLILHLGPGTPDSKTPGIAFVAHMDELGYEVKAIEEDGRLRVEDLGGGSPQYFLGHPVLVHTGKSGSLGGVLELPQNHTDPGFDWQAVEKAENPVVHVYVGTKSKAETEKLGIAVGDFATIPKEYRALLSTRANARSFDDRVGCAALIMAVRQLGPDLPGRDVTFVWSTEEEVGLKGAAAFAENAAMEGRIPQYVFAIDTFVSSDSPLESTRFADAKLGAGFVIRAVDNSNVAPTTDVNRVVALANKAGIPVQYGVTGGGNDGSVFVRYGSVDIPLGWPLRYSHSPAEVIDTKDLDALARIVEVLAKKW
jgi:putative aminopeptidase FrvX